MATATFNGRVIAQSDDIEVVEGNPYFPIASLDKSVLVDSDLETGCPWKGTASYWSIEVDGVRADNAAWYYTAPLEKAAMITDRVAFYPNKVTVES